MSLPTNPATEWPPATVTGALANLRTLNAWYGGDKGQIRQQWEQSTNPLMMGPTGLQSSSLVLSRAMHVPLAADIARTSADLLFSEPPEITAVEDGVQDRLEELQEEMGLQALLLENAELCAAQAGIYWRATWDSDVIPDRPILSFVQQAHAVPEWRWGVLVAVTFWRVLPTPAGQPHGTVYRHLERYSSRIIEHGLYIGDGSRLGQRIPLQDHPETQGIAEAMNSDLGFLLPDGAPRLVGYVPNMRPNRSDPGSMLGRADIDQQTDLLQAVNDTWSSWMRDLRLAKARMIVPGEYLTSRGRGQGAAFDVDRELYEPLKLKPPGDAAIGQQMQLVQFAIRFAEHEATLKALVQQVVTGAGYSLQTFGFANDAAAAATATEVTARERLSMITRERKTRYWHPELVAMLQAILYLDAMLFGGTYSDVNVAFGDSVSDDPKNVAETLNLLEQAGAMSTEIKVRTLHPDWDDDEVKAEVARIRKDRAISVPDPMGGGELNSEKDPADGPDPGPDDADQS